MEPEGWTALHACVALCGPFVFVKDSSVTEHVDGVRISSVTEHVDGLKVSSVTEHVDGVMLASQRRLRRERRPVSTTAPNSFVIITSVAVNMALQP
jgi:hypothetical protein